ncbi:MAG: UDP-N-acetylmuramate dehydrogenase [Bacilli bacterium]|jgi:UDP-N-acetylmuramate dehydrogenase|nr:UDP-N-acetylmuramate dehydrogenase [Bacilli bacterium]
MKDIKGIIVLEEASLLNNNTYKIPSICKYLITVNEIDGLIELLKYLRNNNIKYFILGAGSNVVLGDYFDGAVIKLNGLNYVNINDLDVVVGAGTMMGRLTMKTVEANLTGLEWAINIPGTVGGSIVGNAGAYNSEMFDSLVSIKVLNDNLEIQSIKKEDLIYNYRHTNIKELKLVVLEGTFRLDKGNKEESLELIKDRCERRCQSQPLDMPSAGSVFRNPDGDYAGRLIEQVGLKGKTLGGAQISLKHANFIVNTGSATSKDIKNLIELVQKEVKDKFDIDLIVEQEILDWK